MAKFRQLHTSFWQDRFVLKLPQEEKFFYAYLLTNTKTTACGVYEIPLQLIQLETGLSSERIQSLIITFEDKKKIQYSYENEEILICNWLKYNEPKSVNHQKCINKELGEVKTPKFKAFVEDFLEKITTPTKGLPKGCQRVTKPLASKQILETKTEKKTSSLDQTSLVDIDNSHDDYDDDISKTLSNWGVTDISTIRKAYSTDEINQSISMVKQYKPANNGAYLRTLLKNQAVLKLDTCSIDQPTKRCEALQLIDSWEAEESCEMPSKEQILKNLEEEGDKETVKKLCAMWHIAPKPT